MQAILSEAMKRDEALKILGDNIEVLRQEFGVAHLDIFGSVARDEAGTESDIDILVEFLPDARISLFEFSGLRIRLEEIVGIKVDLGTVSTLKKQLEERVLREKIRVF